MGNGATSPGYAPSFPSRRFFAPQWREVAVFPALPQPTIARGRSSYTCGQGALSPDRFKVAAGAIDAANRSLLGCDETLLQTYFPRAEVITKHQCLPPLHENHCRGYPVDARSQIHHRWIWPKRVCRWQRVESPAVGGGKVLLQNGVTEAQAGITQCRVGVLVRMALDSIGNEKVQKGFP